MRTLLRYLVVSGLAVALAWGVFVVRVGGRTLFGHARGLSDADVGNAWTQLKGGLDARLAELNDATAEERKKKQSARARAQALTDRRTRNKPAAPARASSARPSVAAREPARAAARAPARVAARAAAPAPDAKRSADEVRVKRLGEAQKLARAMHRADAAAPPKTTKVDERIPASGHARVDALLDR